MKILIANDGSECADAAIEDLKRAGFPAKAEAVVMTVADVREVPISPFFLANVSSKIEHLLGTDDEEFSRNLEKHRQEAQIIAENAAGKIRKFFPEWKVSAEAVSGKPADELIKKSDEWNPELLVIGSHGRSAAGRLILGSVSHKVLHEAHCPVRISKQSGKKEKSAVRILLAVDGSQNAEQVVKTVAGRHWSEKTEIRLIAVDDPFTRPEVGYIIWNLAEDKPEESEKSREWISKVIEKPAEILKSAGLDVSHHIRWGDAANVILDEAEEWNADTIFVGARGVGRLKRFLLGSVSSAVAARAHCSVEVVRK